jgi:anti-sigma-K factor RskA
MRRGGIQDREEADVAVVVAAPQSSPTKENGKRWRAASSLRSRCACLAVAVVALVSAAASIRRSATLFRAGGTTSPGGSTGGDAAVVVVVPLSSSESAVAAAAARSAPSSSSGAGGGANSESGGSSPGIASPPRREGRRRRRRRRRGDHDVDIGIGIGIVVAGESDYAPAAAHIASRWNLTSPHAVRLLEMQFRRNITGDYDPERDFLHFHHIAKTGGTSISDVMNATLGVGGHGILPGSHRSGEFDPSVVFDLHPDGGGGDPMPYLASYAHTRLRPAMVGRGDDQTDLSAFFGRYFALPGVRHRRLRSLAMLREPADLRASAHAMAMCSLNGRVKEYNLERKTRGLEQVCTPDAGLNVSALWDDVVESAMSKCPNGGGVLPPLNPTAKVKVDRYDRFLCKAGRSAMDYCRGPTELLSSVQYRAGMRNMYRGLMGRYSFRERMISPTLFSLSDPDFPGLSSPASASASPPRQRGERANIAGPVVGSFSLEEVERYTLVDLGGLYPSRITREPCHDPPPVDGAPPVVVARGGCLGGARTATRGDDDPGPGPEPDFLWFGITERMEESTCLFYHTLNVRPLVRTPRARVMDCPTTSWWTEKHREEVRHLEPYDYAVWRAANAILDVRIIKMRYEVRRKMEDDGGLLTREERDQYLALEEAGCLGL